MPKRPGRYQVLRRAVLAGSVAATLLVPFWNLRSATVASGGRVPGNRWARLAERVHVPAAPPPIVGAPWTVRIAGLEILDPLAASELVAARAWNARVGVGVLPALVLLLVLGRFFCGWLCPYLPILAVSNAVRELLVRFRIHPGDARLPRRSAIGVLVVSLLVTAFAGSQVVPLVYPPSVIGRELFRAVFFGGLGLGALVLGGAFAFDTFVSRAGFCRYLCPGGALFGLLALASPVRLRRSAPACTDCTLCDRACNLLQQPMSDRVDFSCERCGKCVAACPTDALQWKWGRPLIVEALGRRGGEGR